MAVKEICQYFVVIRGSGARCYVGAKRARKCLQIYTHAIFKRIKRSHKYGNCIFIPSHDSNEGIRNGTVHTFSMYLFTILRG